MLESFSQLIINNSLIGIFLSVAVESCGIPFPTEAAFIASNLLIVENRASLSLVIFVLTFSQLVGSTLAYFLGSLIRKGVISRFHGMEGSKINEVNEKVIKWYHKYGLMTVFATRLIGYVRPWSSFVAGIAGFNFYSFLFWTTLGSVVYVFISLIITKYLVIIWLNYPALHIFMIASAVILFFGFGLWGLLKKYQKKLKTSRS
jgi:membrane protein DedA with SNARE-associated domain